MINFSEIGCGTNTDCPNQKACINALCIDPCAQSDVCTHHQECQVDNHQVVCIEGKPSRPNVFCSMFDVMHKCKFSSAARDPASCSHCSGGTCDSITGACVKGNFTMQNFSVLLVNSFSRVDQTTSTNIDIGFCFFFFSFNFCRQQKNTINKLFNTQKDGKIKISENRHTNTRTNRSSQIYTILCTYLYIITYDRYPPPTSKI